MELLGVVALGAAVGCFIFWQAVHGGDPSESANENSPIELMQLGFVLVSALLAGATGWLRREGREGYALASAFFLCMAIRECDKVFDTIFFHGAWLPFALVMAAAGVVMALIHWRRTLAGIAEIVCDRAYGMLCAGMATVFAFSRILGYKKIWLTVYHDVCGIEGAERLCRTLKNIAEEGTELFGYALIFVWAAAIFRKSLRNARDDAGARAE
jgi:hypothetical protein